MCVKTGARGVAFSTICSERTSPAARVSGVDSQARSEVESPFSPEFQYSSEPTSSAFGVLNAPSISSSRCST